MRNLTTAEVARMTTTQGESFNDVVTLHHFTVASDSLNQLVNTFDSGASVTCGILTQKEYRNYRGELVTIDADAVLRFAMSQAVHIGDKVVSDGVSYSVDGIQIGRNVQIIPLKEVKI